MISRRPVQVRNGTFDRILRPAGLQQRRHIAVGEGRVHAELQEPRALEGRRELGKEHPQKAQRRLPVVEVAGPILHAQHLAALRLVRGDLVVARYLALMRIEAALRPRHAQPGRHTEPSTSIVSRLSPSRSMAAATSCALSRSSPCRCGAAPAEILGTLDSFEQLHSLLPSVDCLASARRFHALGPRCNENR